MTKDRIAIKKKGYTLRSAAKRLDVNHVHLMRVLNGQRESARLLKAARALQPYNKMEVAR